MPGPTLTFGLILATLCGAGFHLVLGGGARRLGLFLLAGWVGFGLGHLVGVLFEIDMVKIGALFFLPAITGAFLLLLFVHGLTATKPKKPSPRTR